MKISEIAPNMIFRYGKSKWCRHGPARAIQYHDRIAVTDTYWTDPNMHELSDEQVEAAEYIGNLDDFRASDRNEADRYLDSDVIFIPIGGCREQWWVRKSGSPDRERVIQQLNWRIEDTERGIRYSQNLLKNLKEERDSYLSINSESVRTQLTPK